VKCSGDSNQAFRVATAPSGSSLRDFDPFFFPLDPSSMVWFGLVWFGFLSIVCLLSVFRLLGGWEEWRVGESASQSADRTGRCARHG